MQGLTRIGDLVFTNLTDWFSPPMLHFRLKVFEEFMQFRVYGFGLSPVVPCC